MGVAKLVIAPGCGPGGRGFESHHSPHTDKPAYLLDMRVFPCIIGVCGSFEFDSVVSQMRRQNRISDSNLSRICHGADRRGSGPRRLPSCGAPDMQYIICLPVYLCCVNSCRQNVWTSSIFLRLNRSVRSQLFCTFFAFSVSHPLQLCSALKIF